VTSICYADDLVLLSTSRFHLQQALHTLQKEVTQLGLEINHQKTEAMKFRRGGRTAKRDELFLATGPIPFVNHFPYLGILIPYNATSFGKHIQSRARKALIAMDTIQKPWKLSLKTALQLFTLNVASVAAYGIEVIWNDLKVHDMVALEKVKSTYLKRVLCLHTSSKNRLTYLLSSADLFMEELRKRFSLPETTAYRDFIVQQELKFSEIDPKLYETPAFSQDGWKGINNENRHLVTRFAVHGFHHCLCIERRYHQPCDTCLCRLCGQRCELYHASTCPSGTPLHKLAAFKAGG